MRGDLCFGDHVRIFGIHIEQVRFMRGVIEEFFELFEQRRFLEASRAVPGG